MDIAYLLRGMVIGFSIAAPVGPIGVLCIRRTLAQGRVSGLVTGLGAATADAVYGAIAAFGLTFISGFLVEQQQWLGVIGGCFLCYLGGRTLLARPAEEAAEVDARRGVASDYLSTFALTLTNPVTILSFAAIFAGLGLAAGEDYWSAGAMVLGVFAGSAGWWLLLSGATALLRSRITPVMMVWVNRASGLIILALGAVALVGLVLP